VHLQFLLHSDGIVKSLPLLHSQEFLEEGISHLSQDLGSTEGRGLQKCSFWPENPTKTKQREQEYCRGEEINFQCPISQDVSPHIFLQTLQPFSLHLQQKLGNFLGGAATSCRHVFWSRGCKWIHVSSVVISVEMKRPFIAASRVYTA